jgi:hypothetical protein
MEAEIQKYIEFAVQENLRADYAARKAAEAADRAYLLGPNSVAFELSANEARIASSCATTANNALRFIQEVKTLKDALKWVKVVSYAANQADTAAEDAHKFAGDETLYT